MSSAKITYYRKRRSDGECCSSDSDEDSPPVKRSAVWNKESSMFPKYLLHLKDIVASKFINLVNWIYQLPLGSCEKENMLRNSIDVHVPIEVEDDEIDVVQIDSDDDDDPVVEKDLTHNPDKHLQRDKLPKSAIPLAMATDPLSSSTPFLEYRVTRGRTIGSLSRQPVNGCNSKNPTRDKRLSSQHLKLRPRRGFAPATNPCSDVEILLDTRERPSEESDDLEILSEIPHSKSSRRILRQTISPVAARTRQATKEYNGTSPGNIMNGKAASSDMQRSFNKSFTAHEVIRLQEKAHYQLILDKMIGTTVYHPVVPKKVNTAPDIQENLTGDKPLVPSHFKKEVLEKPVNEFLQKYYKPCQLKPLATPKGNTEDLEIFTVDDDVQVIEPEKSSYRLKAASKLEVYSTEWINEFKKIVNLETEKRLQIVAAQEEKVERYRKRRDAKIEKEKLLRGQSISSDHAEKDEFPELTPDMEERVDWAYGPGSPDELLSSFKDCTCNRQDIATLLGLSWLNDSVINFYLALVVDRSKNHPIYPSIYSFNTYFYTSLKARGPKGVMRWTRKIEDNKNIFQFDVLFLPVHLGMHWALCVIDNRTKKIKYYDSMLGTDEQLLRVIHNYLIVEKQQKLGITMDPNEYSIQFVKDIPQQMNGSDCGMFTLKYAEYLSRDAPITFSQEHMQYFRRRMVYEILEKRLF